MTQLMQPPRGTYDALPEKSRRLRHIEETAMRVFKRYNFGEIRTPIFEFTDVFARNVGEATDIVSKEMYTFDDRGGESLSLRPEGTAGTVRAYYSNKLKHSLPLKVAYIGAPMFRYERPQKGRYRQFHQIGVEVFGSAGPMADVEVIAAGVAMLKELGIGGKALVKLNSLGTPQDRENYRKILMDYFAPVKDQLSEESQARLDKNPLRVLDSKEEEDKKFLPDAPLPIDHLCDKSQAHFEAVKKGLDALGIAYEIDATLVRGLDYYTHTVFEVHGEGLGAQSQVIGGGRYDGLFAQMGGEDIPAVGFGCGLERLEMLLDDMPEEGVDIAFVVPDEAAHGKAMELAEALRNNGKSVYVPLDLTGMKSQFKKADKLGAPIVAILGESELADGIITVKDMLSGEQTVKSQEEFIAF